jgi:GGDEF domain-containing protein
MLVGADGADGGSESAARPERLADDVIRAALDQLIDARPHAAGIAIQGVPAGHVPAGHVPAGSVAIDPDAPATPSGSPWRIDPSGRSTPTRAAQAEAGLAQGRGPGPGSGPMPGSGRGPGPWPEPAPQMSGRTGGDTASSPEPATASGAASDTASDTAHAPRWDPLTRLHVAQGWSDLIATEEARAHRYQRPWALVQLEVAGIAVISERMGEDAAERILRNLAEVLQTATRRSDVYGRVGAWRIQGFLPETDAKAADAVLQRVRTRFDATMGGILPHGFGWAIVAPEPGESAGQALSRAERQLQASLRAALTPESESRTTSTSPSESPPAHLAESGGAAVPAVETPSPTALVTELGTSEPTGRPTAQPPQPEPATPGQVRAALSELEAIRADRLVSKEEYRSKRAEILARL